MEFRPAPLPIVGSDLDSTLCNTKHRQGMIDRVNGTDWEAYSMECVNDTPGPALPILQLLTELEYPFVIVSGRSECARDHTMKWLANHGVHPWHVYLSDKRHNYMPHGEWKAMKIQEVMQELNCTFRFFLEDHSTVAEALLEVGIPTVLVHDVGKLAEMLG